MKALIAILFLINCLAFFMFSHVQKQSEIQTAESQEQRSPLTDSSQSILLLSEISADQLAVINTISEDVVELIDQNSGDIAECEVLGPFENRVLADGALADLLGENSLESMIISDQNSSKYWLKIPLDLSVKIVQAHWVHYENKKRYKEVCMKVAYTLKFH